MDFTRYRINISARVLLILGLSLGAFFVMLRTSYWSISIWILVFVGFLTINLIRFFERSRIQLYRFVSAIKSSDFSPMAFSPDSKSEIDIKMNRIYNEISAVFRNIQNEKEFNHQYLQILIEHVNIAIVCFTDGLKVQFCNRAALELFGKPYFHDIASFKRVSPDLSSAIEKVKRGNNKLVRVVVNDELLSLTISSAEFIFLNKEYKLVTFYNINPELEKQELESWKKLIRTITHEVNNSAIPITNLTHFIAQTLINKEGGLNNFSLLSPEIHDDLIASLSTIEKRSNGLVAFINSTRDFTRRHKPVFSKVSIKDLTDRVLNLLAKDLYASRIKTEVEINPVSLKATMDPVLFEQVIINLILNSIDALGNVQNPQIIIRAIPLSESSVRITVSDNGKGIKPEDITSVFVPYFTTKTNGTGLGLSICRNITDLHKGQISVRSEPGSGTVFTINV